MHSPHGWGNQDFKKLNDLTKAEVKRFEIVEKLIWICKTPVHSRPHLLSALQKSNHEATQMQIKLN